MPDYQGRMAGALFRTYKLSLKICLCEMRSHAAYAGHRAPLHGSSKNNAKSVAARSVQTYCISWSGGSRATMSLSHWTANTSAQSSQHAHMPLSQMPVLRWLGAGKTIMPFLSLIKVNKCMYMASMFASLSAGLVEIMCC